MYKYSKNNYLAFDIGFMK